MPRRAFRNGKHLNAIPETGGEETGFLMEKNDMLARALGNLPFRRNVRAREFTTFRIGGPVTFFAEPKDADELCAMLSAARSCDYPVYIIGNGSNLLVSDSGVEALFIRIGARMAGVGFDGTRLKCGAGALLCTAAKAAVAEGLAGLEWAAGIPGTVGGAVAMNAGAYGGEIKQVLKSVTVVECGRMAKKKSFMRAILGTEALFTPFRMPLLRERSLNLLLMPTGKLGAEWRNSICAAKKSSRLSILPQEALLNGPRGISQVR